MSPVTRLLFGIVACFSSGIPVSAQDMTTTAGPEDEFPGWAEPLEMQAAGSSADLSSANLIVGQTALISLLPDTEVAYPHTPGKRGSSASHAGLFQVRITEPGTYRVALGAGGWIDIVTHGHAMVATGHSHGPEGSTGIRKIIDYNLKPGRYIVQIAANEEPRTTILIVRSR